VEQVLIHEGERNRVLTVNLAWRAESAVAAGGAGGVRSADSSEPAKGPVPTLAWVLGGAGLAALGAALYFEVKRNNDLDTLQNGCGQTHSCMQDDVDAARAKQTFAEVSLGVGVVALGAAAYLFLSRPSAAPANPAVSKLRLDFKPAPGGGTATFGATF
jgi:hypothetical protein